MDSLEQQTINIELEEYDRSLSVELCNLNLIKAMCTLQGKSNLNKFLSNHLNSRIAIYGGGVNAKVLQYSILPVEATIIDRNSSTMFFSKQEVQCLKTLEMNEYDLVIVAIVSNADEIAAMLKGYGIKNVVLLKDILVTLIPEELK